MLGRPLHPEGNIVVANYGNAEVLTFAPSGQLLRTEHAAQPGSDGLVIMPDGTKYEQRRAGRRLPHPSG